MSAALAARDAWAEQVWASSSLRPLERLVALVYADHARDGLTDVWVTTDRLRERTGLSRDAAFRALKGLRKAGWLVVTQAAVQHRATRYALVVPTATDEEVLDEHTPGPSQQSASRTPQQYLSRTAEQQGPVDNASQGSASRTPEQSSSPSPDTSSPSPDTSSPSPVPDYPSHYPPHHQRAGAGEDGRRTDVERAAGTAGVPPDVLDDVVDLALADADTHSPGGRMARDGRWRDVLVAKVRQQRAREGAEQLRTLTRSGQPECEHGQPGGANRHPSSGALLCPLCRAVEVRQLAAVVAS